MYTKTSAYYWQTEFIIVIFLCIKVQTGSIEVNSTKQTAEQRSDSEAADDEAASTSSFNSESAINHFGLAFDSDSDDCDAGENKWLPMAGRFY